MAKFLMMTFQGCVTIRTTDAFVFLIFLFSVLKIAQHLFFSAHHYALCLWWYLWGTENFVLFSWLYNKNDNSEPKGADCIIQK